MRRGGARCVLGQEHVSYSFACLWEEVGRAEEEMLPPVRGGRGLMSRNARILSVSRGIRACLLVQCRVYFIFDWNAEGERGGLENWGGDGEEKP